MLPVAQLPLLAIHMLVYEVFGDLVDEYFYVSETI
jgi:hypothetical protein